MKVLKFGGTSVKNATNINKAAAIIGDKLQSDQVLVVVSAFGGITNKLIEASSLASKGDNSYAELVKEIEAIHIETAQELTTGDRQTKTTEYIRLHINDLSDLLHGIYLIRELSARTLDIVQSFGERLSAFVIAQAMNEKGVESVYLDSREVIKTDKHFGYAKVDFDKTNKNIQKYVASHAGKLIIATGFIASTNDDETTTLGRSGSDYSGAIFAGAVDASVLEIWTDVSGMMTADPRKVKRAFSIRNLSYAEAMELSHFGAKVLEPRTVQPAMSKLIPVLIKNTFKPEDEGTLVTEKAEDKSKYIRGISSIDKVSLITLQGAGLIGQAGISHRLFEALHAADINVILITQGSSEHSITFAVLPADSISAKDAIELEFELELKLGLVDNIVVENNLAVVAVVGENMKSKSGISGKLFAALGKNGVNVSAIAQGASELNISVVIEQKDEAKALNAIHESFFLSNVTTLNVFAVGTGVIGGTLLKQIDAQRATLIAQNRIDVKVVGITNAEGHIVDEEGIDLTNWEEELVKNKPVAIEEFVAKIEELNLRNSVFVDNTASKAVGDCYERLLAKSVSVVTPNKVANASDYDRYKELHAIAAKTGARFLYETNVGAGLPIISTLKDLINSGDEILKMEAILSGSLNYIFSNISSEKDFAAVVKEAKANGFTEPDPKLDLSGMDVARKILILSREIGCQINLCDVQIENCLTTESQKTETVEQLWETLENFDNAIYTDRMKKVEAEGKRLKYIATYENGKAATAVKEIGPEHPFYNILGSDNIIAFTTARYKTNPLIVIGPGAGAEVTAAGVFADIIRIGNY